MNVIYLKGLGSKMQCEDGKTANRKIIIIINKKREKLVDRTCDYDGE